MFSMNDWVLEGRVISILEKKNGYWVVVKGVAKNPSLFSSDIYKIDCWISKKVSDIKPKKDFKALGRFVFKKDEMYFVVEKLLNRSINERKAV